MINVNKNTHKSVCFWSCDANVCNTWFCLLFCTQIDLAYIQRESGTFLSQKKKHKYRSYESISKFNVIAYKISYLYMMFHPIDGDSHTKRFTITSTSFIW